MNESRSSNGGWLGRLVFGLKAPYEGYAYLRAHPFLWKYTYLPFVINLAITGMVIFGCYFGVAHFYPWMDSLFPEGWLWNVIQTLAVALMVLLLVGLVLGLWIVMSAIFCSVYYGILAEKVELSLGTPASELGSLSFVVEAIEAIRAVLKIALVSLGFLLFGFIPVVGVIISTYGALVFNAYIYGFDFFDYPMALRGRRRADKIAFARSHKPETIGLGMVGLLFSFLPVLGSFLLTFNVVGAVLLYQKIKSPLGIAAQKKITQ